jgi:arylsulfatase A-like enzyme
VMIVLDDLGFSQLGCFGSDIETPNLDRLAANGLRYNRFHVTSLCSPTRACLLTGRNHHAVGVGFLVDMPFRLPGYTGHLPKSATPLPRLLRDAGYSTMAVGKWHLTPRGERSHAGPFDSWPSGFGFESFYGFLQGDTNHWTPNLVRDHHYIDPPRSPEDGYHLTEDLADVACRSVLDRQQSAPSKPFFLYFAPGAMHAPHHVPPGWAQRYAGKYDDGWEKWRERAFARQQDAGIVPREAVLTPRPSWVQAWDDLDPESRRLFARQQEIYAGFLTHTDAQIGRLIDSLEEQGALDDTIVMVLSDNGASAEGGRVGTFNEHRFTLRMSDTVEANQDRADDWGGFRNYPHYAWGWAWAGNTPFRLWKRYAWLGGVRTPLIVHWPAGIRAGGEVRSQFCHAIDLMPTLLEACGVPTPDSVDGATQQRVDGASLLGSFDNSAADSPRDVQYFEMLGSRSLYLDGWKATTNHISRGVVDEELLLTGSREFDDDAWELFNLAEDFSEAHDVAEYHPDRLARMVARWEVEADANQVKPIYDGLADRFSDMTFPAFAPAPRSVFRPDAGPVSDESVPMMFGGARVTASVDAPPGAQGVLCALGDWNGGFAMYVQASRLTFALTVGGEPTTVTADTDLPAGPLELSCDLLLNPAGGTDLVLRHGAAQVVGQAHCPHALPPAWQHGGAALRLGHDVGFPVCEDYQPPFAWTGDLHEVVIHAGGQVLPPEDLISGALHAD